MNYYSNYLSMHYTESRPVNVQEHYTVKTNPTFTDINQQRLINALGINVSPVSSIIKHKKINIINRDTTIQKLASLIPNNPKHVFSYPYDEDDYYANRMSLCELPDCVSYISNKESGCSIDIINYVALKQSRQYTICSTNDSMISDFYWSGNKKIITVFGRKIVDDSVNIGVGDIEKEIFSVVKIPHVGLVDQIVSLGSSISLFSHKNPSCAISGYDIRSNSGAFSFAKNLEDRVCRIAVSNNNQLIAAGLDNGYVKVFDVRKSGQSVCSTQINPNLEPPVQVAWLPSSNTKLVCCGGIGDNGIHLYDTDTSEIIANYSFGSRISRLSFIPVDKFNSNSMLAVGSGEYFGVKNKVGFYNIDLRQTPEIHLIKKIQGHIPRIVDMNYSVTNECLVTRSGGTKSECPDIKVWNINKLQLNSQSLSQQMKELETFMR